MTKDTHTWAIVLAAGDGNRLRNLTSDRFGRSVPKQYCSLFGGSTLLEDALRRALVIVDRPRVCTIVAQRHYMWWRRASPTVPRVNIIVEPSNRGTAHGILLAALTILQRDPQARLVFLPADHYVEDEMRLGEAIASVAAQLQSEPERMVLLGIAPDEPDTELGYIVPRPTTQCAGGVERFVEKPNREAAQHLIDAGALWNSLIFAARGETLIANFQRRIPATVEAMSSAVAQAASSSGSDCLPLDVLYQSLLTIDFSRHLLAGSESQLRVVATESCGWTDLGIPRRVAKVVRRASEHRRSVQAGHSSNRISPVNLSRAWAGPGRAGRRETRDQDAVRP